MGGENPAARIWKNTNRLADQIRTEAQLVVQGLKSPGQIKRELMHDYDVSFHQAERLIDTEISYVLNKANLEQYRRYGVGKVTIVNLDVNDSSRATAQGAGATSPGGAIGTQPGAAAACAEAQWRQCVTCEKCKALEGQVFRIEDAPVLPIHPRCHCSYCVPAEGDDAEVTASGSDLASVYADAGVEGYERVPANGGRKIVFSMAEIRSEPEVLRSGVESGIMPASTEAAGDGVRFVCNLDRSIYSCVTENITTSEVIITEKQVIHIFEGHSEAEHAKVVERLQEAVENPDYILRDEDPRTAVVLKEYKAENEERYRVIIKLAANDPKHPKNSIITAFYISRKKWDKYLRNKEILYIRPGI